MDMHEVADAQAATDRGMGKTWTTAEMTAEFTVEGFASPFVLVTRKSDGARGSLEFQHMPRIYFNWQNDLGGDDTMSIQTTSKNVNGKVNGVNGTHQTASGAAVSVDPATAMRLEIERLKAENAALSAAKSATASGPRALSFKVSEKGAVSVYGMGRFPITLYGEQWDRLLDDNQVKALKTFIEANRSRLSKKADK